MFKDLVKATRSFRNFDPAYRISDEALQGLIELCRYTPSTANKQAIKFAYAASEEACSKVFNTLGWAGYLTDKPPYNGNVPAAYILVCFDTSIMPEPEIDAGICAQTIVLGAMDMGLGACMLGNFKKAEITDIFDLPQHIIPRLVIALGRPAERVELVDVKDGDIKYYRGGAEVNYVPKRSLSEIMLPQAK